MHGQYYDFLHLLTLTGKPSPTHTLVFNGDLVDRGSWSTEILLTVLAYKCAFPAAMMPCDVLDADSGNRDRALPQECIREPWQP